MAGINKVIIIGNVGKVEVRSSGGGLTVANLSVATSEKWKDKNTGNDTERTEWHNIVYFGKVAEIIGQYVTKGSKVYVEGSLKTEKYDKDGVTHYATKIMGRDIQFLSSKADKAETNESASSSEQQYRNKDTRPTPPVNSYDDEPLPF